MLLGIEKKPYPEKKKYVFSKTMKSAAGGAQIIGDNFIKEVMKIKNQPGKDIWLFGGEVS